MRRKNKNIPGLMLISLLVAANFFITQPAHATGEVVINEIAWMGTVESTDNEWIELYNNSAADIELTGCTLAALDGTPTINLAGTISAGGYFLLERTDDDTVSSITADQIYTGAMGNSGEQLELKDSGGVIIDTINQGSGWTAGDNNTKQTMERNGNSWQTSADVGGTPKAPNSSGGSEPEPETPPHNSAPWTPPLEPQVGEVVINELVSDPVDGGQEWIELYNRSDRTINLSDFTISEGSGAVTTLSGSLGTYESSRYFVIYSPKGNLNNAGDVLYLNYKETLIDQVTYGNWDDGQTTDNAPTAPDPHSLSRLPDGVDTNNDAVDFSKATPTPGTKNILASSTTDDATTETPNGAVTSSGQLSFNELYPNPPLGDLQNEFIELINLSGETIDLTGWSVSDDITTYIISPLNFTSTYIPPHQIFLLPRPITGIALDNSNDEKITLRSPDGKSVATASYSGPAVEGLSWTRDDNGEWLWSTIATPGKNNNIKPLNKSPLIYWELPEELELNIPLIFDASDTVDPDGDHLTFTWDFGDNFYTNVITPTHVYSQSGKYTLTLTVTDNQGGASTKTKTLTLGNISANSATNALASNNVSAAKTDATTYSDLDTIKNLSSRTKVTTVGVVAVSSGTFNKDLFLAGSGLQLYLNNGSWPEFVPGDRVQVTGTVSQTKAYGSRLLVAQVQDIKLLEKTSAPPAKEMSISDLSEDYEGWLIQVEGEVTRKDKTSVTLLNNDQILKVNFKNNGPWPDFAVGNQVSATGFLVLTNGEFRLWPRDADDVVLASAAASGEVAGVSDIVIEPTNNNWLGYFFIALAVLIILAGWWWEKHGRPKPVELWQKIWNKGKSRAIN